MSPIRPILLSVLCLLCLLCLQSAIWAQGGQGIGGGGLGPGEQRYLYVVTPGIRDYLEFGGAGILVFDIKNDHKFVKRIQTPASKLEKPRNIKGVCASAVTNRLYFTTPEKLYCVDLKTEQTLWEVAPKNGCDRMSITPDGKILYVPSFEKETWNVIDAMTGETIQEIETKNGAHNTVVSLDGTRMFMGGLKSPNLFVADTSQHKLVEQIGPFGGAIRPFTVNAFRTRAYVCVNDLLGFEIGDLTTGKVLHRVEVAGFKPGPVKRHGCPSHGIGLTPDEREVWVVDGANQHVHVFDNTVSPPKQLQSIALREQPGWITFGMPRIATGMGVEQYEKVFAYLSTGEVIDTHSKKIIHRLTDELGREVHSEKMVEIHMLVDRATLVADQFGVGRAVVQYQRNEQQQTIAAHSVNLPLIYSSQCLSGDLKERESRRFSLDNDEEELIGQALSGFRGYFGDPWESDFDDRHRPLPVLKLNFVVANDKLAAAIPRYLSRQGWGEVPISIVFGSLPGGQAVGVDGVILQRRIPDLRPNLTKICFGPRVYISGQAEKGATTVEAAANTIASLKRTLEWLGCETKDAVQAKCFMTQMEAADNVRAEFDKVFGKNELPLVFVEWKSDLPIEIELIANAPPAKPEAPAIEFLTPPGMTESPVYSRVVRVNRGNLIHTAGLTHSSSDANKQVVGIFDQLRTIFKNADSDFGQLAKATYYVTNDATSKSLNDLRPRYYDPKKPPAASKAMIPNLGEDQNVNIMIDMIGVSNP